MNTCGTCNHQFTYGESYKGYWGGWKTSCSECGTTYHVAFRNRIHVMIYAYLIPMILAIYLSVKLTDGLQWGTSYVFIFLVLIFPFSFIGIPFIEFTIKEGTKMKLGGRVLEE